MQGSPRANAGESPRELDGGVLRATVAGHDPHAFDGSERDPLAGGELGLIIRDVVLRTGGRTGLVAVWNTSEKLVDVICAWGGARIDDRLASLPAGRRFGFVGRVLETGHAAFEPSNQEDEESLGLTASGVRLTHGAGAAVRVPRGPRGALCVWFSERPRAGRDVTLWMLERYAGLAALCMHDAGMLDGLVAASRVDGLTGLLNHAAIQAELDREIARGARHGRPLSCCFIDLDDFKRVNDRHGHQHGSGVLADVAGVLRDGVRIGDTLGRYGGDEFVAILPDTDYEAACVLAERLRATIAGTRLNGGTETLDASVGVAQWRPGSTSDELLAASDHALREAKSAGGGIVVGAGVVVSRASREVAREAESGEVDGLAARVQQLLGSRQTGRPVRPTT
jgi:diguanylate cyclase (GGDEF)-like protein